VIYIESPSLIMLPFQKEQGKRQFFPVIVLPESSSVLAVNCAMHSDLHWKPIADNVTVSKRPRKAPVFPSNRVTR